MLDLAYVGTHSVGLVILWRRESGGDEPLGQNLTVCRPPAISAFKTIEISFNGGFGSYNALQAKLEKRFRGACI